MLEPNRGLRKILPAANLKSHGEPSDCIPCWPKLASEATYISRLVTTIQHWVQLPQVCYHSPAKKASSPQRRGSNALDVPQGVLCIKLLAPPQEGLWVDSLAHGSDGSQPLLLLLLGSPLCKLWIYGF